MGKPGSHTVNVIRTEGWRVMKMFDYVGDNINNGNASNIDFERNMRHC